MQINLGRPSDDLGTRAVTQVECNHLHQDAWLKLAVTEARFQVCKIADPHQDLKVGAPHSQPPTPRLQDSGLEKNRMTYVARLFKSSWT